MPMRPRAPKIRARRLLPVATLLGALGVGVVALAQPTAPGPGDEVVARIGERTVAVRDVQAAVRRIPPHTLRALGATPDDIRHGVLESLIRDQVLAGGARAEGLDRLPEVRSMR